jgi:hypothetical protein
MPQPDIAPRQPSGRTRFVLRDEYVWVSCPVPGLEELQVEVRRTLTNGEVESIKQAMDEFVASQRDFLAESMRIAREADAAGASDDAEERIRSLELAREADRRGREQGDRTHRALLEQIAPHIRAWNGGTDEDEDAPPPAEAGVEAFRWVNRAVEEWLVSDILNGVLRQGKALSGSSTTSPPTPGPAPERKRRRDGRSAGSRTPR